VHRYKYNCIYRPDLQFELAGKYFIDPKIPVIIPHKLNRVGEGGNCCQFSINVKLMIFPSISSLSLRQQSDTLFRLKCFQLKQNIRTACNMLTDASQNNEIFASIQWTVLALQHDSAACIIPWSSGYKMDMQLGCKCTTLTFTKCISMYYCGVQFLIGRIFCAFFIPSFLQWNRATHAQLHLSSTLLYCSELCGR
jgi:hypothetical protein